MKSIVIKLSGFAKFELDHKLGFEQFNTIVMKLSTVKDTEASSSVEPKSDRQTTRSVPAGMTISKERMEQVLNAFNKAYKDNVVPF
jgi:hypothetical protein